MKKKSIQSIIFAAVLFTHLIFVSVLCCKTPVMPSKKAYKPMLVKTIHPAMSNRAEKKVSSPISHTPSQSKPTPIPLAVPSSPKPSQPKVLIEKKKNPIEKKLSAEEKPPGKTIKPLSPPVDPLSTLSPSLLRELEESIAKIEDKSDKNRKAKILEPKRPLSTPVTLQIDSLKGLREKSVTDTSDYASLLAQHLHASLHLPDFGEVKIELTLKQDGTIAKLKVLKAESEQNKKYLESILPQLKLPHLTGAFAKQDEHIFVLNFCNEL